jgi:hypothetical protein
LQSCLTALCFEEQRVGFCDVRCVSVGFGNPGWLQFRESCNLGINLGIGGLCLLGVVPLKLVSTNNPLSAGAQ